MNLRKHLASRVIDVNGKIQTAVFCDPGVDDALMLLAILSSQTHAVKAIIPGAGNVSLGTTINNTLKICELVGKTDVPVYPGCVCPESKSETEMIDGKTVYGDDGLNGVVIPEPKLMKTSETSGVAATVKLIENDKTLLISTGGLTDVYRVLKQLDDTKPDALRNIIGISIMGGVVDAAKEANAPIGQCFTEFNILFDPIASAGVFALAEKHHIPIYLSALDLTHSILCSEADIQALKSVDHPAVKFAYELLSMVPNHYKIKFGPGENGMFRQPLHDVHAAICVMHPDLYDTQSAVVSVQASGDKAGKMKVQEDANGSVCLLSIRPALRNTFLQKMMESILHHQRFEKVPSLPAHSAMFVVADGTNEQVDTVVTKIEPK